MSDHDPVERLVAEMKADLGGALEIEAGLREALTEARHTEVRTDLTNTLQVEAGLAAIVAAAPPAEPTTSRISATADRSLAALLMKRGDRFRLVTRGHPAVSALADVLAVELASVLIYAIPAVSQSQDGAPSVQAGRSIELQLKGDVVLGRSLVKTGSTDPAMQIARARGRECVAEYLRLLSVVQGLPRESRFWPNAHEKLLRSEHVRMRKVTAPGESALAGAHPDDVLRQAGASARNVINSSGQVIRHLRKLTGHAFTDLDVRRKALDRACNNFTGADLRGIDLTGIALDGLRWNATTQWPSEQWRSQVLLDSVEVSPGVYEITYGGSADIPTHAT